MPSAQDHRPRKITGHDCFFVVFSKSIDIWLCNFAHLFTIMTPTCRQEEVTLSSNLTELSSFFDLEFTFKFAYHLRYFHILLTSGFETSWNCILFFESIPGLSLWPITVIRFKKNFALLLIRKFYIIKALLLSSTKNSRALLSYRQLLLRVFFA
jgi:hypothetical protein